MISRTLALFGCLSLLLAAPWHSAGAQSEFYQVPDSTQAQLDVAMRGGGDFDTIVKIALQAPRLAPQIAGYVAKGKPQSVGLLASVLSRALPTEAPAIAAALALQNPAASGVIAQAASAASPGTASAIRAAIVRAVPVAAADRSLSMAATAVPAGPGATGEPAAARSADINTLLLPDAPLRAPGRGNTAIAAAASAEVHVQALTALRQALARSQAGGQPTSGRVTDALGAVILEQIRQNPTAVSDIVMVSMGVAVQMWRTLPPAQRAQMEADVPAALLMQISKTMARMAPDLLVAKMPQLAFALSRALPEIVPTLAVAVPQALMQVANQRGDGGPHRPILAALVESTRQLATVRPDLLPTVAQIMVQTVHFEAQRPPGSTAATALLAALPPALVEGLLAQRQGGTPVLDPAPVAQALALALADALPPRATEIAVAAIDAARFSGRNAPAQRAALVEAVAAGLAVNHPIASIETTRRATGGVLGVFQ